MVAIFCICMATNLCYLLYLLYSLLIYVWACLFSFKGKKTLQRDVNFRGRDTTVVHVFLHPALAPFSLKFRILLFFSSLSRIPVFNSFQIPHLSRCSETFFIPLI